MMKSNGTVVAAESVEEEATSLLTSVDRCVRRHKTGTMYGPDGMAYWSREVVRVMGTVCSTAPPEAVVSEVRGAS